MPSRRSGPSAHDVARLAGVSQAAVSRAFTEGGSIRPETRDIVLRAAARLGYQPNLVARSLIMGRTGLVGVVVGDARNPFYVTALAALTRRLAAEGKQVLVFTTDSGGDGDVHARDLLRYRVDALLLMASGLSSRLAEQCRDEGVPVVFFNRRATGRIAVPSVTGDNAEGARRIAEHLLSRGYRRLAFLAGVDDSSTSREREAAFSGYLAEKRAPAPLRATGNFDRATAMVAVRELLGAKDPPDAIFCANDYMALATIEVARHELGLRVGHDVGVAGFDDIDLASWPSFSVTTYSQPIERMTEAAMRMLLRGEATGAENVIVEGELLVRDSTRRRRGRAK